MNIKDPYDKNVVGRISPVQEVLEPTFKLDWRAYFLGFCEAHGEPILYGGRLLFADGWQYSSTDYQGPEFPPPQDARKLLQLQVAYWSRRVAVQKNRLAKCQADRQAWREFVETRKGAPLKQQVVYVDEEGKRQVQSVDLDLSTLDEYVSWLKDDVDTGERTLETLRAGLTMLAPSGA